MLCGLDKNLVLAGVMGHIQHWYQHFCHNCIENKRNWSTTSNNNNTEKMSDQYFSSVMKMLLSTSLCVRNTVGSCYRIPSSVLRWKPPITNACLREPITHVINILRGFFPFISCVFAVIRKYLIITTKNVIRVRNNPNQIESYRLISMGTAHST